MQASHPQVADLYEMAIKDSEEGARLVWRQKPEHQQWARSQRGSLSAAYESDSQRCCRSLEEVYAADGSGSRVPYAQERVGHSTALPSAGKAGEGARAGRLSGLCTAGDTQT